MTKILRWAAAPLNATIVSFVLASITLSAMGVLNSDSVLLTGVLAAITTILKTLIERQRPEN